MGGDCQTFSSTRFTFDAEVPIAAGKTYYAELTSPAPNNQNQAYFIKGGNFCRIVTETGSIVPGTDCSSGFIPPATKPSLSVIKKGPANAIAPGSITYTVAVSNTGDGSASGASIRDQLPPGMSFNSFSGTGWSCSVSGTPALVSCRYSQSIAPDGTSSTLRINASVDDSVSSVTNWASVDPGGGTSPILPTEANCTAADVGTGECDSLTTTLEITSPFLDIALSDPTPTPANTGTADYVVTVTNNGTMPKGAMSYFVLPAGTTYQSAGGADWDCQLQQPPGNVVGSEYQAGPIPPNYSYDFTVTVQVNTDTPGGKEFVA